MLRSYAYCEFLFSYEFICVLRKVSVIGHSVEYPTFFLAAGALDFHTVQYLKIENLLSENFLLGQKVSKILPIFCLSHHR